MGDLKNESASAPSPEPKEIQLGNLEATLSRCCSSEEEARILAASISPDNDTYATARAEGAMLTVTMRAKSLRELQRTVDDILACLGMAEKSLPIATQTRGGTRTGHRPKP